MPREEIVSHFLWMAREGLEREASQVWNSLAGSSAEIEAIEVFPDLRRAYDDGLVNPKYLSLSELNAVEAQPRGEMLAETRDRYPPIDDVAEETAWWGEFNRTPERTAGPEPLPGAAEGWPQRSVSVRQRQEVQEVLRADGELIAVTVPTSSGRWARETGIGESPCPACRSGECRAPHEHGGLGVVKDIA